jgi:F0F1-type ATP synthase assembly protein I
MTAPESPRGPSQRSWAERYQQGQQQGSNREYWADMDSGWVMVAELVTAVFLWGGIGWLLDRWLTTGPWLMCAGFFVGGAAGFYLVYLRSMGRIGNRQPPADLDVKSRDEGAE